jgi:hypothetical protein
MKLMKSKLWRGCSLLLLAGSIAASIDRPQTASADVRIAPLQTAQLETGESGDRPTDTNRFQLLDRGIEPRQELSFSPAENSKEILSVVTNMDMNMSIAGRMIPAMDMPGMMMKMETVVDRVEDNGDIHLSFVYTESDVMDAANSPPMMVEAIRSELQKIVGMTGTMLVNKHGATKLANFDLPGNIDPNTQQLFDRTMSSIEEISTPLPSEAIGVGARWQIVNSPAVNGMKLEQIATYEIVELQDNQITLDIAVTQNADPQTPQLPGMPPDAKIDLKSYTGNGRGRVILQLDKMMPVRGSIAIDSNTQMEIGSKSSNSVEAMPVEMDMTMQMDMESL